MHSNNPPTQRKNKDLQDRASGSLKNNLVIKIAMKKKVQTIQEMIILAFILFKKDTTQR